MAIGSLKDKDEGPGYKHWRKRWAKGQACCYVAIQTPAGGLLQTETALTEKQMTTILHALGLRDKP